MFVYALRSKKDNGLYIGISKDPVIRLREHNSGTTISTKSRRPFELIYQERCRNRIEAREREKKLKSGFGREFLKEKMLEIRARPTESAGLAQNFD